jgi:hypothetical protein
VNKNYGRKEDLSIREYLRSINLGICQNTSTELQKPN